MPELPEVETVVRGLRPPLVGHVLTRVEARRPDLRVPLPTDLSERLTGRRVRSVGRRAKYILVHTEDRQVLIAHLGMSGRMTITRGLPNAYETHDHVVFETDGGDTVRFNDPRRFGLMLLTDEASLGVHPLLRDLGPEPLDPAFTGRVLAGALAGRATAIKAALLDQKTVSGIGNIYACEALFQSGLSPSRQASTVTGARAERLVEAVKQVLDKAILAGGSSLRDHVQPSGELGYFQHEWSVYGREGEPCPRCAKPIQRMVQSARSTFFCASCQK